jgi:hypothetical protein
MTPDEIIAQIKAGIKTQDLTEQDIRAIKAATHAIGDVIEGYNAPTRTVAILISLIMESIRVEHDALDYFTDVMDYYLKQLTGIVALRRKLGD